MTGNREEVDGRDDDREGAGGGGRGRQKQIFVSEELNLFFVEFFTSEWGRHHRSADGEERGRGARLTCTQC